MASSSLSSPQKISSPTAKVGDPKMPMLWATFVSAAYLSLISRDSARRITSSGSSPRSGAALEAS
jgi:hypothetical protein